MKPAVTRRSTWPGRLIGGAIAASLVAVAAVATGSVDGSNATLQVMGFDPDRAQLVTALIVGALGAAASALVSGRIGSATIFGALGSAFLFGGTFAAETGSAMTSAGASGSFDPFGWLTTILALIVSGLVAGWAGAALSTTARPAILDALRMAGWIAGRLLALAARLPLPRLAGAKIARLARIAVAQGTEEGLSGRRSAVSRRLVRRSSVVALVSVVLLGAVPVFADMVNYAPDSHMLQGGPPLAALGAPAAGPTSPLAVLPAPGAGGTPSAAASAMLAQSTTVRATPFNPRPWLAWLPSGKGHIAVFDLPAPWKGGSPTAQVTVYTPPGYDPKGSRRYPAIYEAPWGMDSWERGANLSGELDALAVSGAMPPTIVVSISAGGGPYPDSECANSTDGREWYDRFVAQTVVPWVDSHYRTLATPAARAVMGMSQGGYCAPILALHHPDLFGAALAFSGYFHAGLAGPNSARPFGNNPLALRGASPDVVVAQLAPAARKRLYFVVVAQPGQPLYGTQADAFNRLLSIDGYPHLSIAASQPHGWAQVREEFSNVMGAWATWLVGSGVF
jgi:hypothetical protein